MRSKVHAAVVATMIVTLGGVAPAGAASLQHETVTQLAKEPIANLPGKRLVSVRVDYPPGAKSSQHRHATSAFIYAYVVSGMIRGALDDPPERVYGVGESWFEKPGARHVVSENASETQPARRLAVFIVDANEGQLTISDGG